MFLHKAIIIIIIIIVSELPWKSPIQCKENNYKGSTWPSNPRRTDSNKRFMLSDPRSLQWRTELTKMQWGQFLASSKFSNYFNSLLLTLYTAEISISTKDCKKGRHNACDCGCQKPEFSWAECWSSNIIIKVQANASLRLVHIVLYYHSVNSPKNYYARTL